MTSLPPYKRGLSPDPVGMNSGGGQSPKIVSVIMATFNDDPALLHAALESIVNQTYPHWELVVVDDSTFEPTLRVLADFANRFQERIRLRHNEKRLGFVQSLNLGLADAKGDYVARMDGDDISLPVRFATQVAYLDENLSVGIVGSDILIIDGVGTAQSSRVYPHTGIQVRSRAFFRNPIAHPTVMIRREVLRRIGFYDQGFRRAEDYELWLRAIRAGIEINNINTVLLHYRIVGTYAAKRDKANWAYILRAKLRHFDFRCPVSSLAGIFASAFFYALPSAAMNLIYAHDVRKR